MPITLPEILRAPVVSRVISRIRTPQQAFQRFFGVLPSGPNISQVGGHYGGWDIFDNVRDIATGRDTDSGPATVSLNKIGHVSATMWRAHEKKHLQESEIFRTRPLGQGWGNVDSRGQRYVTRQEQTLAQRIFNAREFMISRMLRGGSFYMRPNGDDFVLTDTSTNAVKVDYALPTGNGGTTAALPTQATNSQLIMLGPDNGTDYAVPTSFNANRMIFDNTVAASSWGAPTTAPIFGQIIALNAAFEHQHGMPLRHVWLNGITWTDVAINTELRNLAGSAAIQMSRIQESPAFGEPGTPDGINGNTAFEVVLKALPWLTWHIYDGGLKVDNGSGSNVFTKFIPDQYAIFCPDPSPAWFEMQEGSELVRENVVSQSTERYGISSWVEQTTQPAGFDMITVDNCLPSLLIPKAFVYGKVDWT